MLIAATVTVIISNGTPEKPMEPMTKPAARKFGIIPIKAKLTDLKRNKNITKIAMKTIPTLPIKDEKRL